MDKKGEEKKGLSFIIIFILFILLFIFLLFIVWNKLIGGILKL